MCQSRGVVKWHQGCIFSASSSIFRSQHPLGALARCVWRRHICANAGLHRLPGAGLLRRSLVAWGKHPTHALAYCVWRRHSRANVGLHLSRQALACCAVGVAWCRLPNMHNQSSCFTRSMFCRQDACSSNCSQECHKTSVSHHAWPNGEDMRKLALHLL